MHIFGRVGMVKRRYLAFILMIIFLICLLAFTEYYQSNSDTDSSKSIDLIGKSGTAAVLEDLEVKIVCSGQYERIKVWRKGSGEDNDGKKYDSDELYVFLPAGADIENVSFLYNEKKLDILLDGIEYASGKSIEGIALGQAYAITADGENGKEQAALTFVQSQSLPTAFITTESGSTQELRQDKENYETGTFCLIGIDGTVYYDGKLEWISGRGNSSWVLEKRPYSIKLQSEADLLGMGAAQKWVLLANAYDDSNGIRNQMAYWLAQEAGLEYSCELQFIDLYINEIYAGTYQLCEKIEIHENRLDIGYLDESNEEINPGLDALDGTYEDSVGLSIKTPQDYSGGYILERNYGDKLTSKPFYFTTETGEGFVVRAPDRVSDVEMAYIKACMQSAENAILADDGIDEVSGLYYTELIDMESWAKKFLMNVITKGENIGATSSYFYKKRGDDLIYAGPAWDFDKSFGRQPSIADTDVLMDNIGDTQYWSCLYEKSEFYELVKTQYWESFRPHLLELCEQYIDEWTLELAGSNAVNWIRWCDASEEYGFFTDTASVTGEDSAAYFLKAWLYARMDYLDELWKEE